ncbi:MAG: MFS transporter, partial [Cyanobacteriota/Melainabacteria group bacterium]
SRQTLLVNMVAREDLVNAVSLGSSIFNVARSVGPALAGIIVAMQGEGICFVINAVSYSFALIALCMLKLTTDQSGGGENQGEKPGFRDGIDFVIGHETVLRIICLAVAISLFGLQFSVILPIFASEILGGGVETLGLLRAANGFGALLAALTLASRAQGKLLRTGVGAACVVYGLSLILFSFSTVTWISTLIMLVTGFALVTMLSGGNSLVQLSVPDQLRGRVMSIYMTLLLGLAPAGSVFIGWLAARVGAPTALAINATIVTLAGCVYLLSLFVFKKASATKDGINSL